MGLILLLVVFCVLVTIVLGFVLHTKHKQFSHIPGPDLDSFWFGHLMFIKRQKDRGICTAEIIHIWSVEFGQTFVFWLYHRPVVCTLYPDTVKELLVTHVVPKSERAYGRLVQLYGQRFLGRGLVTEIDHQIWKERRSTLNHAFATKYLREHVHVFNAHADDLVKNLSALADGETQITLLEQLQMVTLDIISMAAFGLDTSTESGTQFHVAIRQVILGLNTSIADPVNRVLPWKQHKFKEAVVKSCHFLRETGRKLVLNRLKAMNVGGSYPDDVLNHMIKACDDPEDSSQQDIILDDFVTFFIAGMETTANLLSFVFMELGRNPYVCQKLVNEIEKELNHTDFIEYETLSKLHYTDSVVKEALRLYPSLPAIFRVIPTACDIGGYSVPGDTEIMLSTYASGRHPDFYDSPYTFNPDRHLKGHSPRPSNYCLFPFGLGPRSCIGQNFAVMEAKILLVKVINKLQIHLIDDQSFGIVETSTLRPKDGVKCTVTSRALSSFTSS